MTSLDWNFRQGLQGKEPQIIEEQLGVFYPHENPENRASIESLRLFAAILLTQNALSDRSVRWLADVEGPQDPPPMHREHTHKLGTVDWYAYHQLERLLEQIYWSQRSKTRLVLADDEIALVCEICRYLESTKMPCPISLPDLGRWDAIHADNFAGGLLNFSAPDALSTAAVRADGAVAKYAAKVREILSQQSNQENQKRLLYSMREALEEDEKIRRVQKVFEVESWVAKPFHYIPGIDALLTIGEDILGVGEKWLERKQEDGEWFVLGARMTDISVRDYLKRMGNL
jgi:hypothetical protein